jgi:hypothetical protein
MAEGNDYLTALMKNPMGAMRVEDMVMEAARDLIKDEIKRHIRQKLDDDPELKANIRSAIGELMEAKVREGYAMVKLGKYGVDLGISLVPQDMKSKIDRDLADLLEKEVSGMVNKMD